jgi:hypothetical protein
VGDEAEADWANLRTPEIHLGYGRGSNFASPDDPAYDERHTYELPEHLPSNQWSLAGEWTIAAEKALLEFTFAEPGAEGYSFTFG